MPKGNPGIKKGPFSKKHRQHLSEAHKGKVQSEATRLAIGNSLMGHATSKRTRIKIGRALFGHSVSKETRRKLSKAHKGKVLSLETRKKMSTGQRRRRARGGPELERMKEKIRKSTIARWKNPTKAMGEQRSRNLSRSLHTAYAEGRIVPPVFTKKGLYCTGWLSTKKAGKVYYRSSWERALFRSLDKIDFVVTFEVQPFTLSYMFNGERKTYFPDCLIYLSDEKKALVEVKGYHQLEKQWLAKKKAGEQYCKKNGMKFFVFRKRVSVEDLEEMRP